MLKKFTVVCGLLLAATAAMADLPYPWVPLDTTPGVCPVGQGAHITYGADSIWGVFPNSDSDETYVAHYGPLSTSQQPPSGHWYVLDEPLPMGAYTYHTGLTFQWEQGSALYVIGADDYAEGDAYLFWYDSTWHDYDIDEDTEFVLGVGSSIVYVPNAGYDAYNQVAGYIYCLPGNGSEFWRYGIEPGQVDYISVLGIFPPNVSTIADQTPLFQWTGGSDQYRLQVSTDQLFSTTVIDVVVYAPEYQTASKLSNAMYYWRTGTPNGLNWTWSTTHNFTLEGGFVQRASIPEAVANGAALAYESDQWCWNGAPSIIAVIGGGSTSFYKYDIPSNTWTELYDTPMPQLAGTSLTTNDPTEEFGEWPAAAFGGSTTSDRPWGYNTSTGWFEYPADDFDPFPQPLGPGATSVIGLRPWSYLTTGSQGGTHTHYFYAIEPKKIREPHEGGSQSGDARAGSIQARVITSHDGMEVEYQLPAAAHVRATLHDAVGRQVCVLDAGSQQPGLHTLSWNRNGEGARLTCGAYFVLLDMGQEQVRLKAVIR
jgi:hypothetical protein